LAIDVIHYIYNVVIKYNKTTGLLNRALIGGLPFCETTPLDLTSIPLIRTQGGDAAPEVLLSQHMYGSPTILTGWGSTEINITYEFFDFHNEPISRPLWRTGYPS